MDVTTIRRLAALRGVAARMVIAGLVLSACSAPQTQPTVDPRAVAEALVELWATQTAEALPDAAETGAPTETMPVLAATEAVTSTAVAMATLVVTPIFTPTSVSAAGTPVAVPDCAIPVADWLVEAWDGQRLGCPTAEAEVVWSAWQPFQRGSMWWRYDSDWSYALSWQDGANAAAGEWKTGGDAWRWDESFPDGHGLTPPPGLVEPIRGFGFVWFNQLGGPASQLGWGTAGELGFCATVQPFERGTIWRSNPAVGSCLDGQFNHAVDPAFPSLFFALYEDGGWRGF